MNKFLFGTVANNRSILNMVLSLYEHDMLGQFTTGFVDNHKSKSLIYFRRLISERNITLDELLTRRKVKGVPDELIHNTFLFEVIRTISSRIGVHPILVDKIWRINVNNLDSYCSKDIHNHKYGYFIGTEFGCLKTLKESRKIGKKTFVIYLSPHHKFLENWAGKEYEKNLDYNDKYSNYLEKNRPYINEIKDKEAEFADYIVANSEFTARTLIDSGIDKKKILSIPLGCPEPVDPDKFTFSEDSLNIKFIYAGSLMLRKGIHHLFDAWKLIDDKNAELHIYGNNQMPKKFLNNIPRNIKIFNHIKYQDLLIKYRDYSAMVFPTLCDGFGTVITEALSQGLPVITTKNAGASYLIKDFKNGFVINPGNPELLAEKINWFILNRSKISEMRINAIKTAESNSWNDFRDNFYKRISEKISI